MGYIKEGALENLKLYKYSCVDDSYMSKYILQPYWRFCLNFVPLSIAPNLVTLIGFFALIVNAITAYIYFPNLQGTAPSWVYLSFAFGIQWYSLMDNLDGKQARRTQNSSPLGELFDHGCDCLTVALIVIIVSGVAQVGTGTLVFIILMICEAGFWMATWEEYHTGSLYLGVVNGPSEGLQLISVFYLLAFFFGGDFFTTPINLPFSIFGHNQFLLNQIIMVFYGAGGLLTMIFNFSSVINYIKKSGKGIGSAILGLISFAIIASSCILWFSVSNLFEQYPFLFVLSIGLCIGELTSRLILAHVTIVPFNTVQRPHLLIFLGAINSTIGYFYNWYILPEYYCLVGVFTISILLFAHYVNSVVYEICNHLDIFCLKINKPKVK